MLNATIPTHCSLEVHEIYLQSRSNETGEIQDTIKMTGLNSSNAQPALALMRSKNSQAHNHSFIIFLREIKPATLSERLKLLVQAGDKSRRTGAAIVEPVPQASDLLTFEDSQDPRTGAWLEGHDLVEVTEHLADEITSTAAPAIKVPMNKKVRGH